MIKINLMKKREQIHIFLFICLFLVGCGDKNAKKIEEPFAGAGGELQINKELPIYFPEEYWNSDHDENYENDYYLEIQTPKNCDIEFIKLKSGNDRTSAGFYLSEKSRRISVALSIIKNSNLNVIDFKNHQESEESVLSQMNYFETPDFEGSSYTLEYSEKNNEKAEDTYVSLTKGYVKLVNDKFTVLFYIEGQTDNYHMLSERVMKSISSARLVQRDVNKPNGNIYPISSP